MHMTFKDMKVFYNGGELVDTNTLDEKWIHDDCILHAVDKDHHGVAVRQSNQLTNWRILPRKIGDEAIKFESEIKN